MPEKHVKYFAISLPHARTPPPIGTSIHRGGQGFLSMSMCNDSGCDILSRHNPLSEVSRGGLSFRSRHYTKHMDACERDNSSTLSVAICHRGAPALPSGRCGARPQPLHVRTESPPRSVAAAPSVATASSTSSATVATTATTAAEKAPSRGSHRIPRHGRPLHLHDGVQEGLEEQRDRAKNGHYHLPQVIHAKRWRRALHDASISRDKRHVKLL